MSASAVPELRSASPSAALSTPCETPRSRLLTACFDLLHDNGARFVVMNHYEGLPYDVPSDVDIAIEAHAFARLDRHMVALATQCSAQLVQRFWHGDHKCAYVFAVGCGRERQFVQLDFFVAFSTRGCPRLLDVETMLAGRRQLRNFFTPRAEVELLFTVMRRLFKADWSQRHCARIAELRQRIESSQWPTGRDAWLGEVVRLAQAGDVAALARRRDSDWRRLRRQAFARLSLRQMLGYFVREARRVASRLWHPTGNFVVVECDDGCARDRLPRLPDVFHRRLCLDRRWFAEQRGVRGWLMRAATWCTLPLRLRRKAMVLLVVERGDARSRRRAWLANWLGLVDQFVPLDAGGDPHGSILQTQERRTARAMRRSGCPTGGLRD